MSVLTREAMAATSQFLQDQAAMHNLSVEAIESGARFTLSPDTERHWLTAVQNSNRFLAKLDVDTCDAQVVENLYSDELGLVSGRTDTEKNERETTDLAGLKNIRYTAEKTQHDTHITFDEYNRWARRNRAKFQAYINSKRSASKGNDMLKIAWHGREVAKTTDKIKNPLGEDVNIGFIERVRLHYPQNIIDGAEEQITIGKGGTYESLDQIVIAMKAMIPKEFQDGLELYASDEFFIDRDMKLVEKVTVTEAGDKSLQKVFTTVAGGIHAETPPFFPEGTLILTSPKNLAIRTQEGSVRVGVMKNHARSRDEFYHESNEFYAVKNYRKIAILTNVKLV